MNLSRKSSEPGVFTALTSNRHQALAFCMGTDAFVAWLTFLRDEGLIHFEGARRDALNDLSFRLTLTGWRRVSEFERRGAHKDTAFVAMPFKPDFDALWIQGIEPAIRRSGWRAVRADQAHHVEKIDDWILNQIRSARFLVAETSDSNAGACFEAGYALGAEKPVVWLAQRATLKQGLHFDIRQYNHLEWDRGREANIIEPLSERIVNTIGRGPT